MLHKPRLVAPSLLKIILSVFDEEVTQTIFNWLQMSRLLEVYIRRHGLDTLEEAFTTGRVLLKPSDPLVYLCFKLQHDLQLQVPTTIKDLIVHFSTPC